MRETRQGVTPQPCRQLYCTADLASAHVTTNHVALILGFRVRVRITRTLCGDIDGIDLSKFLEGLTYEVGTSLGSYLLAEGWAQPAEPAEPAAILPLFSSIHRSSILIVEDDEDMRFILGQLLEYQGWNTVGARDGREGLDALHAHRPSLILLDLAMPVMDGVEFRAAQRKLPDRRLASTPCIVVSARHDAPEFKAPLNAADVLLKPFEADRLLKSVETYARPTSLFR
jgi:CheY-like chemotaxis protein